MKSIAVTLTLAFTFCAVTIGCKPEASVPPAKDEAPLPSGEMTDVVTVTSIVRAVDLDNRMVTLERPDGSTVQFRVGKDVVNLPQVKIGDEVTVQYYESLAYQVKKAGSETKPDAVGDASARAPEGAKPGGEEVRVVQMTATIEAIDKAAGTVTLKDPAGALTTVKARDPKNLDLVAVGDLVEITITEALAISVTTPGT
jgi:Cu/Ag efflux protein CusF